MSIFAHGFSRGLSGRLVLRIDDVERGLMRMLLDQLEDFVAPAQADPDADPLAKLVGIDVDARASDDPALRRLFPDAYLDDTEAASEFRRFTERGLREAKVAGIRTVRATLDDAGDKVVLTTDHARAWLGVLNDLRLSLGTRLAVTEDDEERRSYDDDTEEGQVYAVYDWLGWLQHSLIEALT